METISERFSNISLCHLYDKYTELRAKYENTHWSWILTADYDELVNALGNLEEAMHADLLTMLVYKQNAYEATAADDLRYTSTVY